MVNPVESARRLLDRAGRAAAASGAPACELLVDIGRRALDRSGAEATSEAAFAAGRAFECAARAGMRGALGSDAHVRENAARRLQAAQRRVESWTSEVTREPHRAMLRQQLVEARRHLEQVEREHARIWRGKR